MFGKWGSGKRTFAKQIAIKLAREEGLKIEYFKNWFCLPTELATTRSTVLILDNPLKSQYSDIHNAEIFDCLRKLRTEENNCFQLAVFHCQEGKTIDLLLEARRKIDELFPIRRLISFPAEQLTEIAKRKEKNISAEVLKKMIRENMTISMGKFLKMTLFLQGSFNGHMYFLEDPLSFILKELRQMVYSQNINERLQFRLLLHMMLHNGGILKTNVNHSLSDEIKENTNKEDLIHECIQQLLHSYIEETVDGKAFRIIHDVITRCTLFTALNYWDKDYIFRECHPLILLDCIRLKTFKERVEYRKKIIMDDTLDIGIPTELFPLLAESCMQRQNEIKTMLENKNFRLFEDRKFQIR